VVRVVAAGFEPGVGREVERLIRSGGAEAGERSFDPGLAVAIAALMVNVIGTLFTVVQTIIQAGGQPAAAVVERRVLVEVVPPPGVSEETLTRIVRLAVAEALRAPPG